MKAEGNGISIAKREQGFDESSMQLEAFITSVRKGSPTKGVFEQAYWASVWTLLGQQAMDENRIVTLPNEMKLS